MLDLLFHQLLDAQRALVTIASPSDAEPDRDAVTYWHEYHPDRGDGGAAHARFVRVAASAYSAPDQLVGHWQETAGAAVRAVAAAPQDGCVDTQGHVLTVPDFVSTLPRRGHRPPPRPAGRPGRPAACGRGSG